MTVGLGVARLLVLVTGLIVVVFGLYLIALPGGPGSIAGIYTVLVGLALIVGAVFERVRYRSDATDREALPTGRAGGEPSNEALEPRFRRTAEVFVDPTTRLEMRVWLDPVSGERRYLRDRPTDRP